MTTQPKTRTVKDKDGTELEITTGSGNVFADLGLPDAEELQLEAQLCREIAELMRAKKMTQKQLGALVGLDQADVSKLLNYRHVRISVDRLLGILNKLGRNVEVRISKREYAPEKTRLRVKVA